MRSLLSQVLVAADASVDHSSVAINAALLFNISVQAVVTGTSTGTLKLQYSNDIVDPILPPQAPINWSDVPSATVSIAGAGVYAIPKFDLCYQYVRVVFTHTNAAAGTITANIKALGA